MWLFILKEPSGMIARWIEILSNYGFEVEFRSGKRSGNDDALSRCENPQDCKCPNMDMPEPLKRGPCKACRRRAEITIPEEQEHTEIKPVHDPKVIQTEDSTESEWGPKVN